VTVTRRVPKFLYAAGDAGIKGFSIDPTTGVLTPLASPPFTAVGAITSLAVTRDRKFLYAADFGAGVILGFRIDSSGALTEVPNSPFNVAPTGADAFPSSVVASPTADLLFVTDFGTGLITTLTIGSDGALTILGGRTIVGDHPRDGAITPDGRFTYETVAPGQIAGFSITANGILSAIAGASVQTTTRPQMVTVDPSGRFLYASVPFGSQLNPTPALLAFAIDSATGVLSPVTGSPFSAGENPASVAADPSGRFLYVTNVGDRRYSKCHLRPLNRQ